MLGNEVVVNMKKLILIVCALFALLGLGYLGFKKINKAQSIPNNILFSIEQESLTIPEFEEYLKLAEEKSGVVNPERAQRYYIMFWRHNAIHAWNKKHKIDQLPEYQKDLKQTQEWQKAHPEEVITDRKDVLENRLKCMILIECWWRDIDNSYFVRNFPLFKPYIEKNQLSFDQFGALNGQMILALNDELKTIENADYFKKNNIKGIDHLAHLIKHPELVPKKYEYSITNTSGQDIKVIIYAKDDEIVSEVFMDGSGAWNKHDIPLDFKNEEHIKMGVQKVLVQAVDNQNKVLQEKVLPLSEKHRQGDFQVMIDIPEWNRKEEAEQKGLVFYAHILGEY